MPKTSRSHTEEFKEFWQTYPRTDKWGRFPETRRLRGDKEVAYDEYLKAIEKISPKELLEALKADIANKKESPAMENPFKYMKSIHNWLKQEEYLDLNKVEDSPEPDDFLL